MMTCNCGGPTCEGDREYHAREADRIGRELAELKDDSRYASGGIIDTVLRDRVRQERRRARGGP